MARAQLLLAQMDQVLRPPPAAAGGAHRRRGPLGAHPRVLDRPPRPVGGVGNRLRQARPRSGAVHHHRLAPGPRADCKVMYHEWAFGQRALTFPDLAVRATAAGAVARLEEGQRRLRDALAGLDDDGLDTLRWTNWGEPLAGLAGAVGDGRPRRPHGGEI